MGSNDIAALRTGLAQSVLREIAERLAALARTGERDAIDLRSLPLTSADRGELEDKLGRGDVTAKLTVGGTSELWETRYSGVWWVRHYGAEDKIAAERIEITAIPEILVAHAADIAAACARVWADLGSDASRADREPATHG
jgi:hydrogenase-1 operon protein HyaF